MKKKIFIIVLSIIFVCIIAFWGLIKVALNTDSEALELENVYAETQTTQDLYNLCTALQDSSYSDKITEYYPLLLNDNELEEFIKKDTYWMDSLENLEVSDIIDTYIITYLGAVCDILDTEEFENQIEIYGPKISFNIYNNIMPILDVIELHFYKEIGVEVSGIDKEKTSVFLNALSNYVNDSNLNVEKKDYINLFIYDWCSKTSNTEKMNEQRNLVSKPFTSTDFFEWEKDLVNGYKLSLSSADNKILLGRDSYSDKFLIDIGYDIKQYAFDNRYICVLQNKDDEEFYYIIDSEKNIIFSELSKKDYEKKIQELNLKLELKDIW